jgi:hypothetical protein
MYREFSQAIKCGDSGRIEVCLTYFAIWYQATNKAKYAFEALHLVASLKKIWTPEFKTHFLENCLVNQSGKKKGWEPVDKANEHLINDIKNIIDPNSTPSRDRHWRNTQSRNVLFYRELRTNIYFGCGAPQYGTHSSKVKAVKDVKRAAEKLMEWKIFKQEPGRKYCSEDNKDCSIPMDLFGQGQEAMSSGRAIVRYKRNANENLNIKENYCVEEESGSEAGETDESEESGESEESHVSDESDGY